MIRVSLASSPPAATTSPLANVAAPPPLVGWARLQKRRDHTPVARARQSTRAVVGERPPATHTASARAKPARWLRGWGIEVVMRHSLARGSNASLAATLPRLVLPPIA